MRSALILANPAQSTLSALTEGSALRTSGPKRGHPRQFYQVVVQEEPQTGRRAPCHGSSFFATLHIRGSSGYGVGHFAVRRNATRILVVTAMGVPSLMNGL